MQDWCFRFCFKAGGALAIFLVLMGCSHGQSKKIPQNLFAAIPETAVVAIYPVDARGAAEPIETITETSADKPIDVAVDALGHVLIANENGTVKLYLENQDHYQLVRTMGGGPTLIQHPTAISANNAGSFYLADAGGGPGRGRVEWFATGLSGNVMPDRVIRGPDTGIGSPRGVAADRTGRCFVSDQDSNKVLVFDADATGNAKPFATLSGLHSPGKIFVDQLLNIYVANKADNSISIFEPSGFDKWELSGSITSAALHNPEGIAVDENGRIVVATTGGILFFPADAHGTIEPIVNLRGPKPMNPAGIFIR
jgi:DNA-binding beta-propeller fold protein YncE